MCIRDRALPSVYCANSSGVDRGCNQCCGLRLSPGEHLWARRGPVYRPGSSFSALWCDSPAAAVGES
eukprot:5511966-Alexandrium_andersonii.AAC.1